MKAEITVTRTPGEIPHEITLSVELDKEGVVLALPVETVYQRKLRGPAWEGQSSYEWTDYLSPLAGKKFPFELEPDEIEEAKKAIARKEQFDRAEACGLGHLFPLAGLSPHEGKICGRLMGREQNGDPIPCGEKATHRLNHFSGDQHYVCTQHIPLTDPRYCTVEKL